MNYLSLKDSYKAIRLIASNGAKLDMTIHQVAVSGLYQYGHCGDLTIVSELCNALPKSTRGNAMRYFITKHVGDAKVRWDGKSYDGRGGFIKANTLSPTDVVKAINLTEAEAHPFWVKEDREPNDFHAVAYLDSVKKRLTKMLEDGKVAKTEQQLVRDALKALGDIQVGTREDNKAKRQPTNKDKKASKTTTIIPPSVQQAEPMKKVA